MWWRVLGALVVGLIVVWLVLLAFLWRAQRTTDRTRFRDVLRVVPEVVRLLRRLASDRTLPRSVRVRLWLLLIYLVSPIDLIPDFIPVLGYADDVVVVIVALRSIVRRSGQGALERHWTGTPEGLAVVLAVSGIAATPSDATAGSA